MDSQLQPNSSFQFGISDGDYKGFSARDQLQCQQKLSLSPKKPVIGICEANYKGFGAHDLLQYDKKLSLSQSIEKHDGYYKGVDAHDQLQYVRKFSLPSYQEPLNDNHGERYQLHEDYLHPRLVYTKELDRGRDKVWRRATASYCEEQVGSSREIGLMRRDCDSRRFNGEIDCSQLHQDVFRYNNSRLDHLYLHEIQSDVGQYGSRKIHTSGETDLNWAIDKDHEDYQHRSSDLNNSRNVTITTPQRRKGIKLCKKFLKGQCKRGASCWYVHDVAGCYHQDHINYKVSECGGPFSSDNSLAKYNSLLKDGYLYSRDILKSHSRKNRYKRYIPRDGDADRLFKKCCTEATRRHEDSDHFEESGRIFRDSISRGGPPFQCKRTELPLEVRRGSESVTEDSYLVISSDESLDMGESNGVIRRQRLRIRHGEFSDGYESLESESSDLNTNGCRRTKEMSAHSEKPLAGKRSRKDSFHPGATLGNRNSLSTKKHWSFKRGKNYYPGRNHLPHKDKGTVLCKYYMKGYCCRGYRCLFSHDSDCSEIHVGMDECKSSVTKRNSVAINEIPHSQDLSSANNTKRSHQKKVQNIGVIGKSMHFKSSTEHSCATTSSAKTFSGMKCISDTDKDIQLDKVKKASGTQEGALYPGTKNCPEISVEKKIVPKYGKKKEPVDSEKVTCGNQIVKGDDGCDSYLMGRADEKHSSVKHIVRKKSATNPSLLNQQNLVPEPPTSNLGSFLNVGQPEEAYKGSDVVDQSSHPSASPKQRICVVSGNESRPASCPTPNKECPPCPLLENGAKLTSQPLSSGSKVDASPKSSLPNYLEERSSFQRFTPDTSVEMPLGHQLELQQRCSSLGEHEKCVYHDQSLSNLIDKKINSCQTPTCGVNGSFEKVDGEDNTQGDRTPDNFVGYNKICGVQELEDINDRINSRASDSCEINQNRFIDQVGERMLVPEEVPLASTVNSAVSFPAPAREDASVDEIGHDMSLDHYIYTTLSLEHYASHMEYDNITTHHSSCKEHRSFVEDTHVGVRSDNLIQHCNVYSSLPTFDGVSETKHFGSTYSTCLSPTRIVWSEVEETASEPNLEQHENIKSKEQEEIHAVKLEPIKVRNSCMEEMQPHVNKEPKSSQKERVMTTESSDKHCESLHVAETVETELISSFSGKGSDFKKSINECGDMPFSSHSKRYESLVSEQIQEAQVSNPKEPAAVLEEDEKCSSVVDSHETRASNEAIVNCNEGDEDGKLLLRLAVLELAKEILDPLWKAGLITSKQIYKTITRKVVNKVCGYVQGVNIPRTKENVDRYLMPRKPKIAQLVLAYVNMYPVKL